MTSKGGYTAAPPPRQGGDRFYNAPAVRRQRQMHLQELMHRQLLQQQAQQHKMHQQKLQQRQLQSRVVVKAETSSAAEKGKEKEKQRGGDDSSAVAALPGPPPVCPASTSKVTNLDRLMEAVAPFVEARFLSEGNGSGLAMPEVDSRAFYYMEDLWESLSEWSVYGTGVPLLINGKDLTDQYYVPYLSGIQLYTDPSKPSSRLRGSTGEVDADSNRSTSSAGSSDYDGNGKGKSVVDSNLRRLNGLSIGDKSGADIANSPGRPVFQFMEHELPFNRRPLADMLTLLTSHNPELNKTRSCDLLPTSWLCVAWYPIYRIPLGPTIKDLEASFLTFHSLSTQSTGNIRPAKFHAANTRKVRGFTDPTPRISLPVFALASYKLRGSIVSPSLPHEREQENSLLQAADNWLRSLRVMLPDYNFFRSHYYSQRR